MSRAKWALLLATQWLVLAACAGKMSPWDYPDPLPSRRQPIPCGQPLPPKCQYQRLSFSELPSRAAAAETFGEAALEQSLQAKFIANNERLPEATFALERVARGFYGDSLSSRQAAERRLLKLLRVYGDDGGAVDLMHLLGKEADGDDEDRWIDQESLVALTWRCRSAKMLHTLALVSELDLSPGFDTSPEFRVALAVVNLLRARGLVELGEYDDARVLFSRYSPGVPYLPDFVPQCMAWLEGRAEELTPVPVGRPCNCEIEPPKWREGCGCLLASDSSEPPASSSSDPNLPVCDPEQRKVPGGVIALDEPCREGQ